MSKIFFWISGIILILFCGLLLVDRYRLNHSYSKIGNIIEKKEQEHDLERQKLRSLLTRQQKSFHVVTEHIHMQSDLPEDKKAAYPKVNHIEPGTFCQFQAEEAVQIEAKKLASNVTTPISADGIASVFPEVFQDQPRRKGMYLSDPGNPQRLVSWKAMLLEAVCKELGYRAVTTFYWDMDQLKSYIRTTISSPEDPSDRAEIVFDEALPETSFPAQLVSHNQAVTVLLPFPRFELKNNDHYEIMSDIHQIPIGGLYLHRIDVKRHPDNNAACWDLEYCFEIPDPDKVKPEHSWEQGRTPATQTKLYAISLLNSAPIHSISARGMHTFRIPFVNGKSSILIMGDTPVLPVRVTARSLKAE